MKFINTIFKKLSAARKLLAVSCKLSRKLLATSYQMSAFRKLSAKSYKLKAILSASRNLPPTTYHLQPSRGFTLIETLVAISILMIAVASPLTIAQKGLASAIYAKDQIIASYLAQDAIEYIINASGQNVLDSTPRDWLYGIKDPCDATLGKKCTVDTSNDIIANCSNGSCSPLKYDYNETSSSHIYRYTEPTNSPFTRSVTVSETVVGVEALITVTVSWKDKNTDRILNFYTRIYNWKS